MTTAVAASPSQTEPRRGRRSALWMAAIGLWLVVIGGQAVVVERFGSDLPVWDQWDAEGSNLFLPYLQDRLSWRDLFTPHNEHRIASTKALALVLLIANGQWDSRLECVVNAALHGAIAALCFVIGAAWLTPRWRLVWWLTLAALMAAPLSWQNIIGGFHSQQVFLLGWSMAGIVLLLRSRPVSGAWWLGAICATLALFSMGSGLLAPAAVIAVVVATNSSRDWWQRQRWTLLVCVALVVAGALLRVEVSGHERLVAKSTNDFFLTLWRSLQWPVVSQPWYPLLGWLPWTWTATRMLKRRADQDPWDHALVALGLWTILQFLAAAYARGAGGEWPASRYFDTVAFGIAINVILAMRLFSSHPLPRVTTWIRGSIAVVAVGFLGHGWWRHAHTVVTSELPPIGVIMHEREATTRAYLATGDRRELDGREIAFPNADVLIARLSHPEIRAIMPPSVRPPLITANVAQPSDSFVGEGVPATITLPTAAGYVGSHGATSAAARGEWRSAPLPAGHGGYWQFELLGGFGTPGIELELRDAASDAVLVQLRPERSARSGPAQTTLIAAPRVATILVARDTSTTDWLAFRGPVEVVAGSAAAAWITRHGLAVAVAGVVLALLTFVGNR